jgi:hypothetical protein
MLNHADLPSLAGLVSGGGVVSLLCPLATGYPAARAFNPGSFYSYTLDPAADVPNLVQTYSGPQASIGA